MKDYSKPPLTFEDQVDLLQERGLAFSDKTYALNFLKRVNYYRLSAYFIPFQQKEDLFNEGAKFHQIVELYEFDSRLRTIIAEALEYVEIFVGTTFAYILSHNYDQFFHEDEKNFYNKKGYKKWIDRVHHEIERSHETFLKHYQRKYAGFPEVPLWMAVEVMTLGSLSFMYSHLMRQDQISLAEAFGKHHSVIKSWLHTFTYIRNVCAHHNRLWNQQLSISMKIPKNERKWDIVSENKVGAVILAISDVLHEMPDSERWVNEWKNNLKQLFSRDLALESYWRQMGITSIEALFKEI